MPGQLCKKEKAKIPRIIGALSPILSVTEIDVDGRAERVEWLRQHKKEGKIILGTVGIVLGLRYAMPYVLPFLLSFCLVCLCDPLLRAGEKRLRIPRAALMAALLLAGSGAALFLLCRICGLCGGFLEDSLGYADILIERSRTLLRQCCLMAQKRWQVDAAGAEQAVLERMQGFVSHMQDTMMPKLVLESYDSLKIVFACGAYAGVFVISCLLFAKDFDRIRAWLSPQGSGGRAGLWESLRSLGRMLGGYLKAQLKIMGVITLLCLLGLWLCGVKRFLLLALLAGALDLLPFIGTGIVLVPAALAAWLSGGGWNALGILALYLVCVVAREVLEPKWIGEGLGIRPLIMLFAIFAGVKFFGLTGILKGPLAAVLIKEMVDKCGKIP